MLPLNSKIGSVLHFLEFFFYLSTEPLRQYLPALPVIYCCKGLHATGFQGSIIYLLYLFITIISMLAVLYITLFLLPFLKYIALWQHNQFPFILRGLRQTILISTVNYKQGLTEELWGPFSKKWNHSHFQKCK